MPGWAPKFKRVPGTGNPSKSAITDPDSDMEKSSTEEHWFLIHVTAQYCLEFLRDEIWHKAANRFATIDCFIKHTSETLEDKWDNFELGLWDESRALGVPAPALRDLGENHFSQRRMVERLGQSNAILLRIAQGIAAANGDTAREYCLSAATQARAPVPRPLPGNDKGFHITPSSTAGIVNISRAVQ
ncbi:hypothetical protein RUND412_006676 [Rhizina undulata]